MTGPDETAKWVRGEVEHLLQVPEFGSAQWLDLEPTDPRRAAAVLLAAEQWRTAQQEGPTR